MSLPVADEDNEPFPQPRHWRAVAKQAREWHRGKAEVLMRITFHIKKWTVTVIVRKTSRKAKPVKKSTATPAK